MFDIGFSELLLISLVALIVLGPERLPKAARFVGLWVRKARAQWYSVKADFERELAADELRRSVDAANRDLKREFDQTSESLDDIARAAGPPPRISALPQPAPEDDGTPAADASTPTRNDASPP